MQPDLKNYQQLNESCPQRLAYHLGSRSGFFAEYINMLQGILFCLQNKIEFQLYSKDANFSMGGGWSDFFLPFCKDQSLFLHSFLNPRFPTPKFRFKLRKACARTLKYISKTDYLSYEVWDRLPPIPKNDTTISIQSLNWQGSVLECYRSLVDMTWRYQPPIEQQIRQIRSSLELPESYAGLHIRRGDKIKEAKPYPLESYIEKLSNYTDIKDVLVLTDDYSIFQSLVNHFSDYRFYTLEEPQQAGYQHRKNKRQGKIEKHADYLKFLSGIETIAHSAHFVGTFSSNIGTFLRLRMPDHSCHGVDYDDWIK